VVGLRERRVSALRPEAFRHAMGALQVVEASDHFGRFSLNLPFKEVGTHHFFLSFP